MNVEDNMEKEKLKEKYEEGQEEEQEKEEENFEQLLEMIGTKGPWNYRLFLFCALCSLASPLQSLSYQFLGRTPNHWCHVDQLVEANWKQEQIFNLAIPFNNLTGERESCIMNNYNYSAAVILGYNLSMDNRDSIALPEGGTIECQARDFNMSHNQESTVTQWDLVCNRRALYSTTFSANFIFRMFAAVFIGYFLDTFGRQRCIVVSSALFLLCGFLTALSPNLYVYIILRTLVALFDNCFYVGSFVLSLEVCTPTQRSMVGNLFAVPWAIGYMLLPGISYVVRTWYWLQVCLTLPASFMIFYYWLLPESPRWLIVQGRHIKALAILRRAARTNGRTLPPDDVLLGKMQTIYQQTKTAKKQSIVRKDSRGFGQRLKMFGKNLWCLVKTLQMFRLTFIVMFTWLAVSATYYGISLNAPNLSTNEYVYMFLGGLLELPSYVLLWPVVAFFGRKNTFILLFLASAISIALIPTLAILAPEVPSELRVCLSLVGKLVVTSAFQLAYLYTGELFPTGQRSLAVNVANVFSAAGGATAPYINDILVTKATWAPPVLFASVSVASAFLVSFLPETNKEDLPESVADAELRVTKRPGQGLTVSS